MNKQSALSRRAVIIAAAVLFVTVVVMTAGNLLLTQRKAWQEAQTRLLNATGYVAENAASSDAALNLAAQTLAAQYGADQFEWAVLDLTRDLAGIPGLPAAADGEKLVAPAYQGYTNAAVFRDGEGNSCAYAAAPVWSGGMLSGVLVARVRLPGIAFSLRAALFSLLAGLVVAVLSH